MNPVKNYRFIPKSTIEKEANKLLLRMQSSPQQCQWPLDVTLVCDFLDLRFYDEKILSDNNEFIAAKIFPTERLIVMNEAIEDSHPGFRQSTLAHEIGHWILHVNESEVDGKTKQLSLFETNAFNKHDQSPFLCRTTRKKLTGLAPISTSEGREWQAQYFASCLLMPRDIIFEFSKDINFQSRRELGELANRLEVTFANLKYRLKDLNLIDIDKNSNEILFERPLLFQL